MALLRQSVEQNQLLIEEMSKKRPSDSPSVANSSSKRQKTSENSRNSSPIRLSSFSKSNSDNSHEDPQSDPNQSPVSSHSSDTHSIPGTSRSAIASDSHENDLEADFLNHCSSDEDHPVEIDKSKCNIPIIGDSPGHTWHPSEEVIDWYTRIADLQLSTSSFKEIDSKVIPSSEILNHFTPPKIPEVLYNAAKNNRNTHYSLTTVANSQQFCFSAIKHILPVLEKVDEDSKTQLATAVQLLANSNLTLNRFRRNCVASCINKDARQSLLSQEVSHNHLFGGDFEKASEVALKDSVTSKIVAPPRSFRSFSKRHHQKDFSSNKKQSPSKYDPGYDPDTNGFKSRRHYRGRKSSSRGRNSSYRSSK